MRILLLTQWFEPEPTFKGLAFARALSALGHEVEVLTGFPNYPGGRVYPGYRIRPWTREVVDGIVITRVALYPSHDRSAFKRVLNYGTFAAAAAAGAALVRRPDVIYAYHPPATIGLPAEVLGRAFDAPVVLDIQDLWPDSVAATGMLSRPSLLAALDRWCRHTYRYAAHIVVLSPGFKAALVARGVPADKVSVIYNWADEAKLGVTPASPELARLIRPADDLVVMFAGTMGLAQGLDAVLDAAQQCVGPVPGARFVFVGGGVDRDRLEQLAATRGQANVVFLPRQPMEAMGGLLALADLLVVHLRDDPLFRITIPSKTQAYLAVGRPVLMAVRGDAGALIEEAGAGLVCAPDDPAAIAGAIARFAGLPPEVRLAMGRAGRAFYERHLSLKAGAERFAAVFSRVVGARAA